LVGDAEKAGLLPYALGEMRRCRRRASRETHAA
jgi:hypothetical protein